MSDGIKNIQDAVGMPAADLYGLRSAEAGGVLFCGVEYQEYAIGGVTYTWPKGVHLKWSLGFSRLGDLNDLDLKACYVDCFKEISSACNVTHEYVANVRTANILTNLTRLDGPSGVLADMQIPVGNVGVETTQLLGRVDDSEAWGLFQNPPAGKIDFYRVALHELLHAHGLGHKPASIASPALIAPMYNPRMRNLQDADKQELIRRYGPPKAPTAPPAPTTPPASGIEVDLTLTIAGKQYKAKGQAKPV